MAPESAMTPFSSSLPLVWENIGFVTGLLLSLALFSFILRDNWLVRVAQYLLVGVSLGYAAILAWQSVLLPRLLRPLLDQSIFLVQASAVPTRAPLLLVWIPLVLGLILWIAGIDHLRGWSSRDRHWPRIWLRSLAILPLGIMAGVGLGVSMAGAIQGTLAPQFLRAAAIGVPLDMPPGALLLGLLTLLITGGALLYLQVGDAEIQGHTIPAFLRFFVRGWVWVGQRALWLAAGFLFAQLFTSRMTLLIARLEYFLFELRSSELWLWLQAVLTGGG
jgi:hypothetical protein